MTEQPRIFTADMSDERRALRLRLLILRTHAAAGQGHLGSSLSIVEILAALLGSAAAQMGEKDPACGDRLVLSKGHAALGLYCALAEARDPARDAGFLRCEW
jgi:transketolase